MSSRRDQVIRTIEKSTYKVEKAKQTVTPEKNIPRKNISLEVAVAYCCLNSA